MNLAAKMWYVQYVRWKKKKIEVIVKNKKQTKKKTKTKKKPNKKENPWCTGMAS